MDDYLTTKQLQELLKVDRITIYRMLEDGRLKGIKIGQQWRFALKDVENLLTPDCTQATKTPIISHETFPTHCVQALQNVFADIAQVAALTIDPDGKLYTKISNPCRFCQLVQSTDAGRAACYDSWKRVLDRPGGENGFCTCHAGLQYSSAPISSCGQNLGLLVCGQFYTQSPDPAEEAQRISELARRYGLRENELADAAREIPVLDPDQGEKALVWPAKVSETIDSILSERAGLMDRLERIAELSKLSSV